MMMRYLGLGVGHLHPIGFPTKVNELKFTREAQYLIDGVAQDVAVEDSEEPPDEEDTEDNAEQFIEYEY